VTGKALSALMATLRRGAGGAAVEYQKGDFVLRIGAAALPPPKETTLGADVPDDDPPPRDWRFALEELSNLNASANRGKLGTGRQ
jgi:hypothetical protein